MKKNLKKSLICLLIVTLIICSPNFVFADFGDWVSDLGTGLVGVFTWIIRAPFMAIAKGLNLIVTAMVKIGAGEITSLEGAVGTDDDFFVTPFHVFFNKITILNANFLDLNVTGTVLTFRTAVAGWYYTMRLIACMVLSVILIYIGIRMAISTIASEKAMYKKMLVDWTTSLALLFLLHYIMIFTFACNDALVNALETACSQIMVGESGEATDVGNTMTTFMTNLEAVAMDFVPESMILSFAAIGVYGIIVVQTLGFVLAYIKRMLTIGFLIIIAPLITITYSIDKIGDGKAQALNTWLKEFVYNILIQPFHCILFMSFAGVAMNLLQQDLTAGDSSIATAVLAVLCIQYVKTGEELVKKIFGFGNASSLSSMAAGTAMAMTALAKSKDAGKVVGATASKAKNLVANNKEFKNLKNTVKSKASNLNKSLKETAAKKKRERVEDKLDKKAEKEANKKHGGHATQEQIEAMRKQIVADNAAKAQRRQEKPFINKVKNLPATKFVAEKGKVLGKGAKTLTALPVGLARDAGKYMAKNSSKIIGTGVGAVLGVAGLANGAAGFAVGYNAGSGIVEGYMSNTNKTIKKNLDGNVQAVANLTGNYDVGAQLYTAAAMGDNDGFKDIKKEINNLLKALEKNGHKDKANNSIALGKMQQQLATNPSGLNKDFIRETIRTNIGEDAANDDNIVDMFTSHMAFEAQAALYKDVKTTRDTGRSIEDMVDIVGDITPQTSTANSGDVEVESEAEINYGMLARDLASCINTSSTDLSQKDIESLNSEIVQLNTAINGLNSSNESVKSQILGALRSNNTVDSSLDMSAVISKLENARDTRNTIVKAQTGNN